MTYDRHNDDNTQSFTPLTKGTMVFHYRIIEKIGSGGMGEVYVAEDTDLNRNVALKFLPLHLISDDNAKARFKREAQAAAALSHPSIVTIYEVSEYEKRPFFVMEMVEGQTLRDMIHNVDIPLKRALQVAIMVTEGLREAHEAGVVHRDIKPANILTDKKDRIFLVDFGLALIEGENRLTKTGSTLGTIGYMSPEQVKGEPADKRSDIFSLGIVLYEMLTRQQPFRKDSEAATLHAIVNDTPDPVSRFNKDIPDELQQIVDKCLQKEPETRYQTVADLLVDLRRVERAVSSELPDGFRQSTSKPPFWRRYLFLIGTTLIVVLMLLILLNRHILVNWLGTDQVPIKRHLVVLPFKSIGESLTNQAFCDGLMETLTSKLTSMQRFQHSLWVVSSSEVREREVVSANQARRLFGVTLAVTGSVQRFNGQIRMTLNLVDTETQQQRRSLVIDDSLTDFSALQDSTVIELAKILEIELQPDEQQFLTSGGTSMPEAYESYIQGRGYLQGYQDMANINTAIGLFQQALKADSLYARAHAGLGEAYWHKYKRTNDPQWIERAITECQHALALNDNLAEVYIVMGRIYAGTGRYDEAVPEFKRALQYNPASHEAYRGLAKTYEAQNKIEEAEETYKKVIELRPDYWAGYNNLGLFYFFHGRLEDAVSQLNRAVILLPDDIRAYNDLGGLYYMLERPDSARAMWERSLKIEPNYGAYSNLGTIYYTEKRYSDAARMYEKALQLDDHDYQVWGNLGSAYDQLPDEHDRILTTYQHAIKIAEDARKINPSNSVILMDLAQYYAEMAEYDSALARVEEALSRTPDDLDMMVRAGLVYEKLGKRDLALKWIGKALEGGYPIALIEGLPEVDELLADPRFQHLLKISKDTL